MALKPTIYKFKISVSDLDRDYFDAIDLIVAQHPSETLERMMARVLAFCIEARENLAFTKGLSSPDEPDIWARSLSDQIELWIDVGEPAPDRIKKATRLAQRVAVYSFNSKSGAWWSQENKNFAALNVEVFQFKWQEIQALAALVERTMNFSITISASTAFIATSKGECEVSWQPLSAV